jgi:hypothetical protein
MAEPHVTAASDQPPAAERPTVQPLHMLAIVTGLALIVGAVGNQAVSLSSQLLPQLPAPGIPALRVLVGGVGACLAVWGLWPLLGPAVTRIARLRPWRRSLPAVPLAPDGVIATDPLRPPLEVRLRCDYPVQVDLNSTVPNVSMGFEVVSHHAVDAVLEKIVFQLWAGQPVLSATMDHRHTISSHTTVGNIFFSGELTTGAVERIRQEMARRAPRGKYTVHGIAYFSSISGPFEIQLLRQERDIPPTD